MKLISSRTQCAFTLIELLSVIGIVGIMIAIIVPVFSRTKEKVRSVGCVSNLRQIGVGFSLWASDHNGTFPVQNGGFPDVNRPTWWGGISGYVSFPVEQLAGPGAARGTVGHCPNHLESGQEGFFSYVGSSALILPDIESPLRIVSVNNPGDKILVYECHVASWWPNVGSPRFAGKSPYDFWRGNGAHGQQGASSYNNSLFADFHVESGSANGDSSRWYYTPDS